MLRDEVAHRGPTPGTGQVDRVLAPLQVGGAQEFLAQADDELLGQVHVVGVGGVGHVPLEHGELGVVLEADALVRLSS